MGKASNRGNGCQNRMSERSREAEGARGREEETRRNGIMLTEGYAKVFGDQRGHIFRAIDKPPQI